MGKKREKKNLILYQLTTFSFHEAWMFKLTLGRVDGRARLGFSAALCGDFTKTVEIELAYETSKVLSLENWLRWIIQNFCNEVLDVRNNKALSVTVPLDYITCWIIYEFPQFFWEI